MQNLIEVFNVACTRGFKCLPTLCCNCYQIFTKHLIKPLRKYTEILMYRYCYEYLIYNHFNIVNIIPYAKKTPQFLKLFK